MHNSSHDEELSLRPDGGFAMDSFALAAQHAANQHAADDSAAGGLLLTLPGSPTLLPLTASPSPPPSGLDSVMSKQQYQQHVQQQQQQAQQQQQQQAQQQQLKQQMSAAMDDHGVQSYFQTDGDSALSHVATSFSREFNELQQSVTGMEDRRFAEELVDKLTDAAPATAASDKAKPLAKKRKAGANVSIDLQTKIRLIELAEEYQYDPKYSGRGKQDGAPVTTPGKDQMSGIRLAQQFGLNKSTVSRILKRKEEFKKAYYKDNLSGGSKHINKKSKFEKLNRLVENWFDVTREKKVAVSDTLIRDVGKRFADELGIEDFRGSNGWVRSLRNRKEHQTRNVSLEALEREKVKQDAEAIERMRMVFPNGMTDMAGFFKDLSTFLEKDSPVATSQHGQSGAAHQATAGGGAAFGELDDELKEDDRLAEEFLKKKMIDSLRSWSQELMEAELSRLKKRLKPRQTAIL